MESTRTEVSLDELLSSATESDMRRAAEAVLTAAVWKQQLRGDFQLSPQMREALVQALTTDPSMTELVFNGSVFRPH